MTGLKTLPKLQSKGALRSWFQQNLMKSLANKPALSAKLSQQTTRFSQLLDALPDHAEDLPPVMNRNDNIAWQAQMRRNAQAHDAYLTYVQGLVAKEIELTSDVLSTMGSHRDQVLQDQQQWDINQQTYAREFSAFDEKNAAHHQAYKDEKTRLRRMLETLRSQYNREFFVHEDMNDASRTIFLKSAEQASMFRPTHHWFNPGVSSGTYFYDFRDHHFQLHIHCKPYDGKVKDIQVKLDSEARGKPAQNRSTGVAIAERFRELYPPVNRPAKKRAHVSR